MNDAVTNYHRELRSRGLRASARRVAIDAIAARWRLTGALSSALRTPRVHLLVLHHVFEDEAKRFGALLEHLARDHVFVSYSEAVEGILHGRPRDTPCIALSFDDGLASCCDAARIMNDHGAKACFFVCPTIVGVDDRDVRRRFCRDRMRQPEHAFMDWGEIEDLVGQGHEVGSHTMTHANLATLDGSELAGELNRSRETITARLGRCEHFAWPFGRFAEFSPDAAGAVFDAGYASCASGARGCHAPSPAAEPRTVCLRRDHVVAGWPLAHNLYFIARSARQPLLPASTWPEAWPSATALDGTGREPA